MKRFILAALFVLTIIIFIFSIPIGSFAQSSSQRNPCYNTGAATPNCVSVGTLTPLPTTSIGVEQADITGTFTNATQTNSITSASQDGYGTALITISGTYNTASGVFEMSDDSGTTWFPIAIARSDGSGSEVGYTSLTNTNRAWLIPVAGMDLIRIRSTAVASGTVSVRISSTSVGTSPISAVTTQITGNSIGTTGAVVGTLAAVATKTTFICGFDVTAIGGTAAIGPVVVAGLITGSATYYLNSSATGVTFSREFTPCISASAINTAITTTTTADGTATNVSVNSHGYQQ